MGKRDSRYRERERDSCIHGRDGRLWRNQNRPLFVTSGYLAGHFRTRVGTYSGHCGLPDISMSCSKLPSNIIVVLDFSMSVGGSGFTAEPWVPSELNNLPVFMPLAWIRVANDHSFCSIFSSSWFLFLFFSFFFLFAERTLSMDHDCR